MYQQLYPEIVDKFQVVEQGVDEAFINRVNELNGSNRDITPFTFYMRVVFIKRA